MTLAGLGALLESTGLPVTYLAWPQSGDVPALPYICYLDTGANPTYADGGVYYSYDSVRVELYTAFRDPVTEDLVELALVGFHWTKDATYIEDERCWMVVYEVDV